MGQEVSAFSDAYEGFAPADNAIYLEPKVRTVAEAIERMERISAYVETHEDQPQLDGLACFNYLYTVITKRIRDGIRDGFFEDAVFMTQLDVEFANRYFDALRVYATSPRSTPRAWLVLLERRSNRRIKPMQFAIAGVNAHINFDLAVAVVDTCSALRTDPNYSSQRADYQRINQIFAEEMQHLRQYYENGFQRAIDAAAAPILNMFCNWSVVATRNAAWDAAERMWKLRRRGAAESSFVNRLDRFASMSGELILTPII